MDSEEEIWKSINSTKNLYEASNKGRVRSIDRLVEYRTKSGTTSLRVSKGRVLSPSKYRYLHVNLALGNGNFESRYVHRLVAEAWLPNPENKPEVNHKDGNKFNNKIDNLEWVTASENITHGYDENLHRHGMRNHYCKLTEDQVFAIIEIKKTTNLSYAKIGDMFNISGTQVRNIVIGRKWKRVIDKIVGGEAGRED